MIVLYDSLTGQGKRFANSLGFRTDNIKTYQPNDHTPVFLITRSFNFGEVSPDAKSFLDKYQHLVVGLAVSGNRNWGKNFGAAGDKIEKQYGIPLILKFEASGLPNEVQFVKKWITNYQNQKLKEK
jgi:ribonucleoside-diphosphate reductase protein NrdI